MRKRLEQLARRPAEVTGLIDVARLRRRLADAEPALEENRRLAALLEDEVAALERKVGELAHTWARARAEDSAEPDS